LRELLNVASGGVVFTTIQKFFPDEKGGKHPLLSDRRNIVVIADEAHRSQYDFIDGFAKHMEGKAMVVCMSRRICVALYRAIQKLRPDWHHDDDDKGTMKIVATLPSSYCKSC
jgi:type I site-specific restriction-modification system R (restriction) subunit